MIFPTRFFQRLHNVCTLYFIVTKTGSPTSFVVHIVFESFLRSLQLQIQLTCLSTFIKLLFVTFVLTRNVEQVLKNNLNRRPYVAVITDLWTFAVMDSYFVTNQFYKCQLCQSWSVSIGDRCLTRNFGGYLSIAVSHSQLKQCLSSWKFCRYKNRRFGVSKIVRLRSRVCLRTRLDE